jgi:2-phosphosulfolactate phosphatase
VIIVTYERGGKVKYKIDAALLPSEKLKEHDCRVVIDLLRAATQMAVFFELGGEVLYPVSGKSEAFGAVRALGSDWKLMGESGGLKIEGFDYGNSPLELIEAGAPKKAVICTSNGTGAILTAASGCRRVIVACARNASAAVKAAAELGERIGFVPSGRNGEFSLEDTACAGMLVEKSAELAKERGNTAEFTDGAKASMTLWHSGGALEEICRESEHGRILRSIGFERDIEFCAETDKCGAVPCVEFDKGLPFIRAYRN